MNPDDDTMYNIKTLDDIKQFVERYPYHPITAAWRDLLTDNELVGNEEWIFDDFVREAEQQASDGDLSAYDLERLFGEPS